MVASRLPEVNAKTLPLYLLQPLRLRYEDLMDIRQHIIFVGGFEHQPNEDAVVWFLEQCWPAITQVLPDVCLYLVGSAPSAEILSKSSERVIVTGWVTDEHLADLYLHSRGSGHGLRSMVTERGCITFVLKTSRVIASLKGFCRTTSLSILWEPAFHW